MPAVFAGVAKGPVVGTSRDASGWPVEGRDGGFREELTGQNTSKLGQWGNPPRGLGRLPL
ncbi:hypothetical protein GCM10027294_20230 [Marinactinospora endophytica]